MHLKGIVEIVVFDNDGIKYQVTQENLIPDDSWVGILGNNATSNYFGSRRISIATDTNTPVASVSTVLNVIGTCTQTSPPIFIENVDPPYGTLTGQISPVGVSRIFYTVALTVLGSGDVQVVPSTQGYAILLLDIPCTQGVGDFVNITYTIQFIDDIGDGFLNKTINRYDLGRALFGFGGYPIGLLYTCLCSKYDESIQVPRAPHIIAQSQPGIGLRIWTTSGANPINFKWNYEASFDRSIYIGYIVNALTQGVDNSNTEAYALTEYIYDKEPIQTGFKHAPLSVIPFFDSANIASSQGMIYLTGTWTNKIPEFYKITFTLSGATGVATYKFSVLKHTGFFGNSYTPLDNQTLYRTPGYKYTTGLHGWRQEDFDIHRLSDSQIVQWDITGISVVDVIDGTNTNYDSTTTPPLTVNNIVQIAVDTTNKLVYVACNQTGLWIVDLTANTTTNQFVQPCYGVDVGYNNVAIALVDGGLYQSTDWVTPAPFTFIGITDSNWDRVKFLKADPENIDSNIAIVADDGSGVNRIVWYRFSDNSAVLGYSSSLLKSFTASLDVSDTASLWVLFLGNATAFKLTYGTNTLGTGYTPFYNNFTSSVYGIGNYSKVSFYQDSYIARTALVGGVASASWTDRFNTQCAYCLNLSDGVMTSERSTTNQLPSGLSFIMGWISQLLPSIAEIPYGWNGSAWVRGSSASKTTHTSIDALINGLTIAFADGTSPPHFVLNEFLTQGVNLGQLQDNATSMTIRTAWYSKPMHNETITPTIITLTVTLPADSDPTFRRLDTDQYQGHRFYIDGVLATKVWLDGTAPAPTEVTIQTNGDGVLTFNAADVGKTLTGNYIWIEF